MHPNPLTQIRLTLGLKPSSDMGPLRTCSNSLISTLVVGPAVSEPEPVFWLQLSSASDMGLHMSVSVAD